MLLLPILALLPLPAPSSQAYACSDVRLRVVQGQSGPEGGQLDGATLPVGATLGHEGRVAFVGAITGLSRNQAVLVSDGETVRAIAVGCGGPGGEGSPGACGDATPLGGTFAGLFGEAPFAPSINAGGDVVFLADIFLGGATRALFFYREASHAIETVAYVGQRSPSGAVILSLGASSLDDRGGVLFLARTDPNSGGANEILANDGGVLSVVARVGDAGPDGPYELVAGEIMLAHDGTILVAGPAPARDEHGRVAHFAATSTLQTVGIALKEPGQPPVWLATFHQPTPAGGTFYRFFGPMFAPNGEVVFSAQYSFGSNTRSGWFAGLPGALRKVFAWGDPAGDLICWNFDRSRDLFHAVGRAGDVVLWSLVERQDHSFGEAIIYVRANGAAEVLAETGSPAPTGGVIAELARSPSIDRSGRILLSARVEQGPTTNVTWLVAPCGTAAAYCDGKPSSLGCEPRIASTGRASATGVTYFAVTADTLPSRRSARLVYGFATTSTPFQGGTLCVAQPLRRTPVVTSTGPSPSDCSGTLSTDFGARIASGVDPALVAGTTVAAQWFVRDPADPTGFGTALSDAITFEIGP